ncbi:carbohydrate ABC transporter permease [Diplocloster modestus]|uniref:Sugar ABC transporter permease n=1 Tax=Diplocloster modestus TaxID=2850322 RepID=A0ABS6K2I1_9FIRM|nr:sugar ABC transporter permease [Diplocloster modestus]MBU9724724.1 sugar ABC transporter permease [Diplocloster modestus]
MQRLKNGFLLFLVPLFLIQLLVYVVPIVSTVCHAFQNTTIAGEDSFTLTGNFAKIAKDLGPVIGRTLIWTFGSIIPSMLLGLAAALVFNRNFFGKKLCVSICLLPYTIPLIIVAVCWYLLYQPNFGLLNTFMQTVGLTGKPVQFLSRNTALTAVIVARIWRSMPFAFISYYAALKSIPAEYMEAAAVDGAGHFQTLRYITLPQLKPITLTTGIILTVWTFLVFDIVYSMTGGGPGKATTIMPMSIYHELISMHDTGAASALSLIAILILMIMTTIYWKCLKEAD